MGEFKKEKQVLSALSFPPRSRGKYWPRILFPLSRRSSTGPAFFLLSSRSKYCPRFFTLSCRGKYWPRFLLHFQPEANTVRAFFYGIKQRQILAAHSSFLHPLNLVGELLLDVDLGICLLEVFLSKPE